MPEKYAELYLYEYVSKQRHLLKSEKQNESDYSISPFAISRVKYVNKAI